MVSKKKATAEEESGDMDKNLDERLTRMEKTLAALLEAATEKNPTTGERRVKATPAQRRDSARRARQSKLAKRCGMSRDEFVAKYGDVDRIPEEADAKVIKYRPKAKRDAG